MMTLQGLRPAAVAPLLRDNPVFQKDIKSSCMGNAEASQCVPAPNGGAGARGSDKSMK
jgi:hypothetical protein